MNEVRLDSWKEIAAYLQRGVTTVQRWERCEGLPVHRLPHAKRGSVYAFQNEIDQWWRSRGESAPPESRQLPRILWAVALALILAVALGAVWLGREQPEVEPQLARDHQLMLDQILPLAEWQGAVVARRFDRSQHLWCLKRVAPGLKPQTLYSGKDKPERVLPSPWGLIVVFSSPSLVSPGWRVVVQDSASHPPIYEGSNPVDAVAVFGNRLLIATWDANARQAAVEGLVPIEGSGRWHVARRLYRGPLRVEEMTSGHSGLITAFRNDETIEGEGIYLSPDGENIAGGGATERVYAGTALVETIRFGPQGAYVALFNPRSRRSWGVYLSPDGRRISLAAKPDHYTRNVYNGPYRIASLSPYAGGMLTSLLDLKSGRPLGTFLSRNEDRLYGTVDVTPWRPAE